MSLRRTLVLVVAAALSVSAWQLVLAWPDRWQLPPPVSGSPGRVESLPVEMFHTDTPVPFDAPVRKIFGGWLLRAQADASIPWQRIVLWSLVALGAACVILHRWPSRVGRFVFFAVASLVAFGVSLHVSQGWDELFINLKHSFVVANDFRYSFNSGSLREGTVDFLPFAFVGVLGVFGLPLIETIILVCFAGNVLLMVVAQRMTYQATQHMGASLVVALLAITFPATIYVGATAFTAPLFSGVILLALYLLFFAEDGRRAGLIVASLLTLVRTEGILLTAMLWAVLYVFNGGAWDRKRVKDAIIAGAWMAAPFFVSALVRQIAFGYPVPNPVRFKNAGFDVRFVQNGFRQLSYNVSQYRLLVVWALAFVPVAIASLGPLRRLRLPAQVAAMVLFVAPYSIGGGDWFPPHWLRYLMPLAIFMYVIAAIALVAFVREGGIVRKIAAAAGVAFFVWAQTTEREGWPRSGYRTLYDDMAAYGERWGRIEQLSAVGRFFRETTAKDTVIASPEIATLNYFAERDLICLLGAANPEIAAAPLNPMGQSGDTILLHRKRDPLTIDRNRPGIIVLYEMVGPGVQRSTDYPLAAHLQALEAQHFNSPMAEIADYRVGGYARLVTLGYRHLLVDSPHARFNYFVHESIYAAHVAALTKLGARSMGTGEIRYQTPPARFLER